MTSTTSRSILITGGGSGIGLAAAKLFLEQGDRVAIAGRSQEKLDKAAESLNGGDRLLTCSADVSQWSEVQKLFATVMGKFGGIDILVCSAGTNAKDRTWGRITPEIYDRIIRANLDGAFYCAHAVLPHFREKKDGLIINVNSIAGKRASPLGGGAYAASKHGMHALAISLAAEEKENGIRCCSIYPGEVDTPILEHRPSPVTEEHRARILQPEDVASAIVFVANLPARATVPELVISPATQTYI